MSLVHDSPLNLGLLQLPNLIRIMIWDEVLSQKENQYIESHNRLSLLLTCRTIHFDLGMLWPKALLENRTFTFPTLESFLKSAPSYTHGKQVLIRSVHIQFHETPDSESYHGSFQVPYSRHKFLLGEILLPKYHGIREWTIDVSNLFSGLGNDTPNKFFMQRYISYFVRYCPAEHFKLIFNTCNGSILNCAQPREGFALERIHNCTLLDFEIAAEKLSRPSNVLGDWSGSTMLVLHRPTLASRVPNPEVPYHTYYNHDPRDPWREIKASVREKITHGAAWRLEIWKRARDTKLDAIDMANASLILPSRIGEISDLRSLINWQRQRHL
ncbi:1d2ba9cb-fc6b-4f12-98da-ff57b57f00b0-CDS [Sclerotinia trifoliorum]|uniref:1d2ba9cb-fc6b-4f12-98da-ff57b57f00b0-CDS n=1 Tax=Sclerotinia trifoliorum TaxID=28548 RepID=A0A8H2VXM3_9HELO|nr:1d2ba9cb-fc6b-4f12-98da-ff57b57f00b0-CDS [Sclerotinia trifoliorum]